MLKIFIKNVNSKIVGFIPQDVYDQIYNDLSYKILGSEFSESFASGRWDGYKRLFNRHKRTFPSGLAGMVLGILEKHNIPCEINDLRIRPKVTQPFHLKKEKVPRKYQLDSVQKALIYGRGIVEIATGGGKSFIIAMIAARLGLPTVIYVNTKDLLYQMIDDLKVIDMPETNIGQIGDCIFNPSLITVATIQSVYTAFGVKYPKFDEEDALEEVVPDDKKDMVANTVRASKVMIIDETQFLASDTFQLVANNSINAYYRYGVSATCARTDNADIMLNGATGKKFVKITASELIDQNYLTVPDITLLHVPKQKNPNQQAKTTYHSIYKLKVTESEVSNNAIVDIANFCYKHKMSVLILVQHIPHGEILLTKLKTLINSKTLEAVGKRGTQKIKDIEFLKGSVVTDKRKRVVALFREQKVRIMLATSLADCGLNIPSLDVLILAGRGKSITRIPQRIGRVLRIAPGKKRALVFDFMDQSKYLRVQSLQRKDLYEAEPRFRIHHHKLGAQKDLLEYLCQLMAT